MFKKNDKFVFKAGVSAWHTRILNVNAVNNKGDKVRTYRAIDGRIWIPTELIRPATKEEVKAGKRSDYVAI